METSNSTEESKEVSSSDTQPQEPLIAGRYRKISKINSGKNSSVWLVADTHNEDQQIALKLLGRELIFNSRAYQRFEQEMSEAKLMQHPGFVRIFDFSPRGAEQHFFTMEYVEAQRLDTLLGEDTGGLSFPQIVSTLTELFEAASFANSLNILLLPIRPRSIFITAAGAKLYYRSEDQNLITASGVCSVMDIPTAVYHAPDTRSGGQVDEPSMIYNLGLLAHEMATGVPTFQSRDLEQLFNMHLYKEPPEISLYRSDIPEWYQSFVRKCLRKSRFWRYHSLTRAIKYLKSHSQGL